MNLRESGRCTNRAEKASCRSGAGADSEAVEAEHGAEIRASLSFLGLKRNAGRVRHSVDRVEQADDRGGIDKPFWAQSPQQLGARAGQHRLVLIENGFGEAHEQPAVRHASIPCGRTGHSAQIIVSILGQAARTEQQGVTGGSIETLVQG